MKSTSKWLAIATAVILAVSFLLGSVSTSYAASGDSLTATKGVYWFDTHEAGKDLTDTFVFDDSLLTGDSLEYNQQLATMSFELAIASISSEREAKTPEGYANKSGY